MNAAQMITVSALFIYRSLKKESRGFLCYRVYLWILFTHFGTKNMICAAKQVKAKLVEYQNEKKLVFYALYALAPVYFIEREVGFIHHSI